MLQFILRRLGLVIPTFIGITLLTFAFVHMIPGDPVTIMAGNAVSLPSVMLKSWRKWGWTSLSINNISAM